MNMSHKTSTLKQKSHFSITNNEKTELMQNLSRKNDFRKQSETIKTIKSLQLVRSNTKTMNFKTNDSNHIKTSTFQTKTFETIQRFVESKFQGPESDIILKTSLSISYPNYIIEEEDMFGNYLQKYFQRESSQKIVQIISAILEFLIFLCIFCDIIILSLNRKNIRKSEIVIYESFENILIIVFAIELFLRILFTDIHSFCENIFNRIDALIIIMNFIFLIYGYFSQIYLYETYYGYVIICLKSLRIFRYIVGMGFWSQGTMLFIEMILSIKRTISFIVIIFILLIIMSFVGMELFAYQVRLIKNNVIAHLSIDK